MLLKIKLFALFYFISLHAQSFCAIWHFRLHAMRCDAECSCFANLIKQKIRCIGCMPHRTHTHAQINVWNFRSSLLLLSLFENIREVNQKKRKTLTNLQEFRGNLRSLVKGRNGQLYLMNVCIVCTHYVYVHYVYVELFVSRHRQLDLTSPPIKFLLERTNERLERRRVS